MNRATVLIAAMSILYFSGICHASDVIYSYDELGRLIQATYTNGTAIHYTYDAAGNRIAVFTSAVNGSPVAVVDSISTNENTAKNFDPRVNDSDPDGDPLTIAGKTNGSHGTVAIVGGTALTYTPTLNYSGSDSFSYTISDGHSHTATANVSVTVVFVNQPPIAVNDTIVTNRNTPITFDPRINDTDPENDPLAITANTSGSHGVVTNNGGVSLTYAPTTGYSGSDSFAYTISDGHGHTATASIAATVTNINVAPVAVNDNVQVLFGRRTLTFDPRLNDTDNDGDALTIVSTTTPTVGTVTIVSGTSLSFNGGLGFPIDGTGTSQFSYTISDGHSHTATATVSIASASCTGPGC